ncbi:MAG TPA: siderophore-interacting protein [Arthrobacter sp.]|nr:siderophore-interacting protein [Arthrobacter sp.]
MQTQPAAAPARPGRSGRPPRVQTNLQVTRTEWLSKHMVRVYASGDAFETFAERYAAKEATDPYIKIFFLDPSLDVELPVNVAELKETLPADKLPVTRTYTVRRVDREKRELVVDFVVHGAEGLAGPWAAQAKPGDWMMFTGPGGAYRPDPDADWYLLAGDDSALPAIAAAIEALAPDARGHAFLEVDSEDDVQDLDTPAGLKIHWLFRRGQTPGTATMLRDAISALEWPEGRVDAFVHGERGEVKSLRDVLFKEHGLSRDQVSISGYWAYGRAEDAFQAEKRTEVGQIFPENERA